VRVATSRSYEDDRRHKQVHEPKQIIKTVVAEAYAWANPTSRKSTLSSCRASVCEDPPPTILLVNKSESGDVVMPIRRFSAEDEPPRTQAMASPIEEVEVGEENEEGLEGVSVATEYSILLSASDKVADSVVAGECPLVLHLRMTPTKADEVEDCFAPQSFTPSL
jgi:hypothetical protein